MSIHPRSENLKKRIPLRALIALALLAAAAGILVLYAFNPADHALYPKCLFHVVTRLDCPGCGGLRAAHQLLHGNLSAAFALNPLLTCLGPALVGYAVLRVIGRFSGKPLPVLRTPALLWAIAVLVIAFGVLRNVWR